jgi:hypothetical protein
MIGIESFDGANEVWQKNPSRYQTPTVPTKNGVVVKTDAHWCKLNGHGIDTHIAQKSKAQIPGKCKPKSGNGVYIHAWRFKRGSSKN